MENVGSTVAVVAGRPEIAGRRVSTAEHRSRRRAQWPAEVRDKGKHVFCRPHILRYDGRVYRLEIRSRNGKGFWIMIDGVQVVYGESNSIALANVIKTIDPRVETVRRTPTLEVREMQKAHCNSERT